MKSKHVYSILVSALLSILAFFGMSKIRPITAFSGEAVVNTPLGTGFTYQGRLMDGSVPANGAYDFIFGLFDAPSGGASLGEISLEDVNVNSGNFTVKLDFGTGVFNGQQIWLEIRVRLGSDQGSYTTLNPRQEILPAPYSTYAVTAPWGGIQNMPPGFADGVDNNTLYTAGIGLNLVGDQFNVITDTIQTRVDSSCSIGSAIRAIHPDGTVECQNTSINVPLFTRTPLETAGSTGLNPAIATGADGLPIIAYKDSANEELKVAHCDNLNCTSASIVTIGNGGYPSIIIGADDLPLVVYPGGNGIKATHCSNVTCSSVTSSDLFITLGYPQLVLGTDGKGLFSGVSFPGNHLVFAHCNNVECTSVNTSTVDGTSNVTYASLIIGDDGLGLVAYDDSTGHDLKIAHCDDLTCSSSTITVLDTVSYVNLYLSLGKSSDGFGLIAYLDWSTSPARFDIAHCTDMACSAAEMNYGPQDGVGWIGTAAPAGQMPMFAYFSTSGLKTVRCTNARCDQNSVYVLDGYDAFTGGEVDLRFGLDGLPVLAYTSKSFDLLVVHCDDEYCAR